MFTESRGNLNLRRSRRVTWSVAAVAALFVLSAASAAECNWPARWTFIRQSAADAKTTSYSGATQQDDKKQVQKKEEQKQEEQKQEDTPIRLSSRLVLVPVSASDANGKPVTDLKPQDMVIEEDGRPQQVVALGEPGKTPIDLALLFDVSGSTQKQFDFEQQAAVQFVKKELKPGDFISIFSIGVTPKMVEGRTSGSREAIVGLMSIEPMNEPTAFFDAVVEAVDYLGKAADPGSRRVLLVISDGEENYSKHDKLSDALRELQKNDCLFYSINPNGEGVAMNRISREGQSVMDSMATQTGGKAFSVSKADQLEAVFQEIGEELQAQYLFGYYTSDEQSAGGGFRRITVRAPKRPDLRIRARQGYYVRGHAE